MRGQAPAPAPSPTPDVPTTPPTPAGQAPDVSTLPPTAVPNEAPDISTLPPKSSAGDADVNIRADGENTYVGAIATADDNVVVRYKGDVLFADHVIYDRATQVMIATGNARLFSGSKVYRGDSITYNLDTKAIVSANFKSADYPRFLQGQSVTTPGFNHYRLTNAYFTTSNRQNPSFRLKASTIEYRPNDEVVMKNVILFIGDVPCFYFPVFVQSLTDSRPTYQFQIGDSSQFGYFIDNKYNWVASDKMRGDVEFDLREKRGYAGGVDVQYYPSLTSDILLKTYYAQDNLYSQTDPKGNVPAHGDLNNGNTYDGVPFDNRYRVAYQHYLQFGPDFSSTADLNLWSDPWVTRDFFQSEYQAENQPANFVSLNQTEPNFTVSLLASPQVNPFFETVERLPELELDIKQQKVFNSPVMYTSQNSVVNFQRKFADTQYFREPLDYPYTSFPNGIPQQTAYNYYHPNQTPGYDASQLSNYSAYRYDTYHEFSLPHQYFNFLTLTPRIGGRFTYYTDNNSNLYDTTNIDGDASTNKIKNDEARFAGNVGLSGDFKISRTWLDIKDPNLGINGIRHEIEPYFDSVYAPAPTVSPNDIRGFDDRLYSTQLQPLDWTENNSIDSIDRQAVVRVGVWNRIQTKRDGANYDLVTLQTYADADFDHNFSAATPNDTFSNLFNNLTISPTPQLSFQTRSSLAITNNSYNEIDNDVVWSPDPSLQLTVGDQYLNHSTIFPDGNQATLDLFYRMNEHWQFEAQEQFEATTGHLQLQEYTVYRDLDAWQLGLTYSDSELNNQSDRTVYFSLTLKAFPKYQLHSPHL